MADSETVWRMDDLMKAAMAVAHDADTQEEFTEQTFQGMEVCARRVSENDAHVLAFFDSAKEAYPLKQVLKSIQKHEQNIKREARKWYHSRTDRNLQHWNETYQKLPSTTSTTRSHSGECESSSDDDSSNSYRLK